MNSAKEMFNELGYKKITTKDSKHFIIYAKSFEKCIGYIELCVSCEKITTYTNNYKPLTLTIKELEAINQQTKELGWIE